jgi:hypothetical protein
MAAALLVLENGGSAFDAAKAARIQRSTLYNWRSEDKSFAARWAEAVDISIERMEAECYRRAVIGWQEPVFGRNADGNTAVVGAIRKFSDRLLEVSLKAKKPHEYRENPKLGVAVEVTAGDATARLIAVLDSTASALSENSGNSEAPT